MGDGTCLEKFLVAATGEGMFQEETRDASQHTAALNVASPPVTRNVLVPKANGAKSEKPGADIGAGTGRGPLAAGRP